MITRTVGYEMFPCREARTLQQNKILLVGVQRPKRLGVQQKQGLIPRVQQNAR